MRAPDIDLTRLYIGDYVADTMKLTADQHAVLQTLLLQLWLQRPASLKERWIRKQAGLSTWEWRAIRSHLLEVLETALTGIARWNEGIKAYDGRRLLPYEWQVLRIIVLARDDYTCVYCGSDADLHVDHRIPVSRGGSNGLENLATACGPCNLAKGAKLLQTWIALECRPKGANRNPRHWC
jgi:hypothetical protein